MKTCVMCTPYVEAVNAARFPFEYLVNQTNGLTDHWEQCQSTRIMAEYLLF